MRAIFACTALSLLLASGTAVAQECPCDCYFSGDCNPGMFCDYGNLGNEDTCFWRQPKPFGTVGAGCTDVFNDWGQCDGFCTPSLAPTVFTHENTNTMAQGVALWGEAILKSARHGGGFPDADTAGRVLDLPFGDPTITDSLGRIAIEIGMLSMGEKSVVFPDLDDFKPSDFVIIDLSADPCRLRAGKVAFDVLIAEIRQHGAGAAIMEGMPTDCFDQRMISRICPDPDQAIGCIYERIQDFGTVIARGGRTEAGAVAGGGCEECFTNDECDDFDPCTEDICDPNGFCTHDDYDAPCDGNGCDDCNSNGILDQCESGNDCNANNIPDECEADPQCSTDFCEGAADVCPGTLNGSTSDASNDGSAGCGSSSSSPDVWYVYTAGSNGTLTVTSCGSNYDTVLSLHSGCPGTTSNQLTCNDDSCGLQSSVNTSVTAGDVVYIRVSGYSGSSGSFTLNVTGPDCDTTPDPLDPPTVVGEGPRYLSVTPAPDARTIAMQVTSPAYSCIDKYIDPSGVLVDAPVYQTPAQWGTVHLTDPLIVPETEYQIAAVTEDALLTSSAAVGSTFMWADVDNDGTSNLQDVQLVAQGFQLNWENITLQAVDINPCETNGTANLADVFEAVLGFQNVPFSERCGMPCP